ncbi:unnamed protein product [Mycena citricolor]|uniref:Uncharacterized protein n=1 Tax=Mycena citricolor TaxID=2018698 RepID=A0AAD2HLR1_9AGAR|nr:unnamed protein product [Mycena citricolor]
MEHGPSCIWPRGTSSLAISLDHDVPTDLQRHHVIELLAPDDDGAITDQFLNLTFCDRMMDRDAILKHVALTDTLNTEWSHLRTIIKEKVTQNVELFLSGSDKPPPTPTFSPSTTPSGGLKLPPFPSRSPVVRTPVNYMTAEEANEMRDTVFGLLDSFDSCKSAIYSSEAMRIVPLPTETVYIRGKVSEGSREDPPRHIDPGLLPTSHRKRTGHDRAGHGFHRFPSCPKYANVFSCIFPPQRCTPLQIPQPSAFALDPCGRCRRITSRTIGNQIPGLVDELDDPSPGHLSEHPVALSSVTSTEGTAVGVLSDRFVSAHEQEEEPPVDEKEGDKENAQV